MNPLRAGLVSDLRQLARFVYSGHSRIMEKCAGSFQDVDKVLGLFENHRQRAGRAVPRGRGIAEASGFNLEIAKNA